jgi:hypothetical protein
LSGIFRDCLRIVRRSAATDGIDLHLSRRHLHLQVYCVCPFYPRGLGRRQIPCNAPPPPVNTVRRHTRMDPAQTVLAAVKTHLASATAIGAVTRDGRPGPVVWERPPLPGDPEADARRDFAAGARPPLPLSKLNAWADARGMCADPRYRRGYRHAMVLLTMAQGSGTAREYVHGLGRPVTAPAPD